MIEMAEFLYKKGLTKDFDNYKHETMIKLALKNMHFKLAEWLLTKQISKITYSDLVLDSKDEDEYSHFLFEMIEDHHLYNFIC
jgi:hypothetical protein